MPSPDDRARELAARTKRAVWAVIAAAVLLPPAVLLAVAARTAG